MSETCGRCGRRLKNPAYIEIGFGRVCAAKMGIAIPAKDRPRDPKAPDKPAKPFSPVAIGHAITCSLDQGGNAVTNIPHRIVRHSPTGFAWGYGGSGPADFALNALSCVIGQERAEPLYQEFKRKFIATLPEEGGTIPVSDVLAWVAQEEGR